MLASLFLASLVSVSLWLFGLNEHGSQVAVITTLLVAVVVSLGFCVTGVRGLSPAMWNWRWGGAMLGLALLMAIQALNPSHRFVPETRALAPLSYFDFLPSSVDRNATVWALWLFVGYVASFWLARMWLCDRTARAVFVSIQVSCGTAMAVVMLYQHRLGPEGALYSYCGAFVGPNHYAAYANLLWPVALMWGREAHRIREGRDTGALAAVHLYLAAAIVFVSVWYAESRMGMMVSLIMLIAWVIYELRRLRGTLRLVCFGGVFIGVVVLGLGSWWWVQAHADDLSRGVGGIFSNVMSRWDAYCAMVRMWNDRWFSGTGGGTFGMAFLFYQPETLPGFFLHAHNETLQIMSELGIVGLIFFIWAIFGTILLPPSGAEPGRTLGRYERFGLLLAFGGLACHAMVDFPLRLPALGLLLAALVGMGGPLVSCRRRNEPTTIVS